MTEKDVATCKAVAEAAEKDPTWDLSDNDRAAIGYALHENAQLKHFVGKLFPDRWEDWGDIDGFEFEKACLDCGILESVELNGILRRELHLRRLLRPGRIPHQMQPTDGARASVPRRHLYHNRPETNQNGLAMTKPTFQDLLDFARHRIRLVAAGHWSITIRRGTYQLMTSDRPSGRATCDIIGDGKRVPRSSFQDALTSIWRWEMRDQTEKSRRELAGGAS